MFSKVKKMAQKACSHSPCSSSKNTDVASSLTIQVSQTTLGIPPLFKDVRSQDRHSLFSRKVEMCLVQFDSTETSEFVQEKQIKMHCLYDLIDFVHSGGARLTEINQQELVNMIAVNLFRTLQCSGREKIPFLVVDSEEEYMDPAWEHLHLVHELLLAYIASDALDANVARKYIDHSFVFKFIDLFESEDRRERDYVKTVLHRIYGKFRVLRPFIRKTINNVFYKVVYENERHSGISEMLEILASIINGYSLPLKEEHKLFLVRVLMPMHKPEGVVAYHHQLSSCVRQFVEKDVGLVDVIVRGMLKFWPITNCQKEVLFLGELLEILEATQEPEFQKCMVPVFKRLAKCITSLHFQVATKALLMWNNDHIVSLIARNRSVILPIVFEALEENIRLHWNQSVIDASVKVRKIFLDMDIELFEECQSQYEEKAARARELEEKRELAWQRLEMAAADGLTSHK